MKARPSLAFAFVAAILSFFWNWFAILSIILMIRYQKAITPHIDAEIENKINEKLAPAIEETEQLRQLAADELQEAYTKKADIINNANSQAHKIVANAQDKLENIEKTLQQKDINLAEIEQIEENLKKLSVTQNNQKNKIAAAKKLCAGTYNTIKKYFDEYHPNENISVLKHCLDNINALEPTVTLKLHALDYQDLRKEFNKNSKLIDDLTEKYSSRYTTKANAAIYQLMVIALRAELQNILYNLKYDKLDIGIENVQTVIKKYLTIAADGNQNIAPTLLKFIGEIENLFIEAVKIEYEYYVKRERAKEEQAMLREQMRQEAAERKLLEEQKEQVLKEEAKFKSEIENVAAQLKESTDDTKSEQLMNRIKELEAQLAAVEERKEDIINLQNGKAGYVYIISNLGSFGDGMFKIGMTRRINPQDRVDELGDASVPFRFDVHSFIFSEDAVSLESNLHNRLDSQRVNKVNMRKEFFYTNIDDLESLVIDIEPTAEFNRTMLAEQYRQSLTIAEESIQEECL